MCICERSFALEYILKSISKKEMIYTGNFIS